MLLLHRNRETSDAYWERWNQLHSELSDKFYGVMKAVSKALKKRLELALWWKISTHAYGITLSTAQPRGQLPKDPQFS